MVLGSDDVAPSPRYGIEPGSEFDELQHLNNVQGAYELLPGPQKVCYGATCNIQIQVVNGLDLQLATAQLFTNAIAEGPLALLTCYCSELGFMILTGSRLEVGFLEAKTSRILEDLQQSFPLYFECIMSMQKWHQAIAPTNYTKSTTVDLNIYGSREAADFVASQLYNADMYLQDPLWHAPGISYVNPQHIDFPGMPAHDYLASSEPSSRERTPQNFAVQVFETADVIADFSQLLDALGQHEHLALEVAHAHIATRLLNHQREGLSFIMQREGNCTSRLPSFWESDETATGQPCFRHKITGARSPYPRDTFGGIVADEMGLGKTLTMLSAICGSLSQAYTYARTITTDPHDGAKRVIAAKSTLIIVPSALLMDAWLDETKRHITSDSLSCYKYHGTSRNIPYWQLLQHDIILTTYGTVVSGYTRNSSLLFGTQWYRVVLDEAHTIRNSSTKQFAAIASLQSHHRWCLTGTPIQNSLDDLGSLVRILKLPVLEDPAQFRRHIVNKTSMVRSATTEDFRNLQILLSSICLRRNKLILSLPPDTEYVHCLDFTLRERAEYRRIEHDCIEALDRAVSGHKVKETHQTILETWLRLRLFCNNGNVVRSAPPFMDAEEEMSLLEASGSAACYYCGSELESLGGPTDPSSGLVTACNRAVCGECIFTYKIGDSANCFVCQTQRCPGIGATTRSAEGHLDLVQEYPTKMLALCEDVEKHISQGKNIIFSSWKKSLDIASAILGTKNISFLRMDGSIPFKKRRDILKSFQIDQDTRVLLMTLGTGAEGLNDLTIANRVHILEPQWNPSVEKQAIGRVVRLGQENSVTIVRYIINKTVEKNVQTRQMMKRSLERSGFNSRHAQILKDLLFAEEEEAL